MPRRRPSQRPRIPAKLPLASTSRCRSSRRAANSSILSHGVSFLREEDRAQLRLQTTPKRKRVNKPVNLTSRCCMIPDASRREQRDAVVEIDRLRGLALEHALPSFRADRCAPRRQSAASRVRRPSRRPRPHPRRRPKSRREPGNRSSLSRKTVRARRRQAKRLRLETRAS